MVKKCNKILPREPKIENTLNLMIKDLELMKVEKPERLQESPFKRDENGYYYEEYTCDIKTSPSYGYFKLSIADGSDLNRSRLSIMCETNGGMFGYSFNKFFKPRNIENEEELELQELVLARIMWFLDEGIFSLPEGFNSDRGEVKKYQVAETT